MDNILKDKRFSKLINDPKYRQIPKKEKKVQIDERFNSMFNNKQFQIKYSVDKRGRPIQQTSSDNLHKYYQLTEKDSDEDEEEESDEEEVPCTPGQYVKRRQSEEDEEKEKDEISDEVIEKSEVKSDTKNDTLERGIIDRDIKKKLRDLDVDYARGEAALFSDSSSDEQTCSEAEDDGVEHAWGELDADAETTDEATDRLAICNMDWDNIKGLDLFVLFNSFLPPGGVIKSVTIYPSEFGQKRLQEEELRGPIELTETKKENDSDNDEENEEGSKYHMEKLRLYQLNRLKYYYAVAVFDSAATANKIYTDCDGIEYESSATKLDLRFIPDDVTFDQEVHDECVELPDSNKYKPRLFTTTALQQAKVELTWDSANPHRKQVLRDAADGDIQDKDLRDYLACSSEEESDKEIVEEKEAVEADDKNNADPISKYKALLLEIEDGEKKKKNRDVEMEISWGMGLKEKTEELVKKKISKGEKMTPFEELVEKKKEKKKAKKLERKKQLQEAKKESSDSEEENEGYSSDDIPSDIDMNDPYFAEEFDNPEFKKPKKSKNKSKKEIIESDDGEEERKKAELELLLDDDDNDGRQHFSLKKIQDAENETKSMKKRKYKEKMKNKTDQGSSVPEFDIDVQDERFSALFTSHHYNIDPTNPNFKKTKNMDKLIQEKLKRRPTESDNAHEDECSSKKSKSDASVSVLVKSLKRKTQNLNR